MKKNIIYAAIVVLAIIAFSLAMFYGTGYAAARTLASYDDKPVPLSLLGMLNVPDNLSNAIGMSGAQSLFIKTNNATPLAQGGKPEILYIGAEYCPYCAAERWALVVALLRFGNFTGLRLMTSSASDYSPSSPTFTFADANYTSGYISFVSVETETNNGTALQQPTQQEDRLFGMYDTGGSIPFLLMANNTYQVGANFDPYYVIYGKNWSAIASDMHNSSTIQAQTIIGSANLLTEQICAADNYTPKSVCDQPYISRIHKILGK